jgi:hypothetical protein
MLDGLIPVLVVASAPRERRSRLAEAMLPGLLPVAGAQRAGVAAVVADQQVRGADRRQEQAVAETVSAVESIATKPAGARKITDQDLTSFPTLKGIVDREGSGATIRGHLDSVASTIDAGERVLAAEAVVLIEQGIAQQPGDKLPEDALSATRIGALILANPVLKAKVVVAATPFVTVGASVPAAPPAAPPAAGGGTTPP